MKKWNNCVLIDQESLSNREISISFQVYKKKIGREPKFNVWYDLEMNDCFGIDDEVIDYYYKNKSFETLAGNHFKKKDTFKHDIIKHKEVFYTRLKGLEKFKGSSILFVGGGPSTNKVKDWENINTDYVWSCNHFYLHPILSKMKVDFVTLGNEVDLNKNNKKLTNYMKSHDTICVFEDMREKEIEFESRFSDQCFFMYNKYRSKIGTAPRILILAAALGVKEIHFVGVDGLCENGSVDHSFELGKKPRGTRGYDLFRRQYVVFWDYMLNHLNMGIKFHNLGEGNKANMTTSISSQEF